MSLHSPTLAAALAAFLLCSASRGAQEPARDSSDGARPQVDGRPMPDIAWERGPTTAEIGTMAEIQLPEGFMFTGKPGTKTFLELTHNPTNGGELAILMPEGEHASWFVCFEFDDSGYIKDDEKDKLDAKAILKTLREGNQRSNEARAERGWETYELVGWEKEPFYDPATNNLTWATRARGKGGDGVQWSTRLLGRSGSMSVDLVLSPEDQATVLPSFEKLLSGFSYKDGHRYAEFRAGDKIAEYGLTALVAGGAGVIAAKTGLLAKMWKFIVVGVMAVVGFFRKLFARLFGRSKDGETAEQRASSG